MPRIIRKHMLPSFMSHIIAVDDALDSLDDPRRDLAELSRHRAPPPVVSWGVLLQAAQNVHTIANAPWLLLPALPS